MLFHLAGDFANSGSWVATAFAARTQWRRDTCFSAHQITVAKSACLRRKQIIPNNGHLPRNDDLMRVCESAGAICIAALIAMLPASAIAGTFDVKGPEVEKGKKELLTNHTFQSVFPANADRVRHSFEFVASHAFTDRFKAGPR